MSVKRVILVTGATGKQGGALIKALTSSPNSNEYHILALTRNASQPKAQQLAASDKVTIVEGDLDSTESIRRIFESSQLGKSGIWGVFCVLAYPGLGMKANGVERQGKTLIDLSQEYGVSHFLLSTAEGCGQVPDTAATSHIINDPDRQAKINIENHLKDVGQAGMKWTILRPGFFMENYEGALGDLTFSIFSAGLKATTLVPLIAVDDIGKVASRAIEDSSSSASQILVIVAQLATMSQQKESYRKATGRSFSSIPGTLFSPLLIRGNAQIRHLLSTMESLHESRTNDNSTSNEYQAHISMTRRIYPNMQPFEEWTRSRFKSNNTSGGLDMIYFWRLFSWNQWCVLTMVFVLIVAVLVMARF